ncbi:hypothetical protein LOTGIDRAFT_161616 [Lottia gigantea]|uniref:Uncharacterized protein n=1 Tax=Lottia gigantea TaxID=225164 RepID=V4BWU9_LOTGI|nr:hypothetical protein LOTGIDRAFT_161616 [Lottia gigantea]ESO93514.1 hypothetical protein LOTGIDRAFT_161616 [Lottia gigantea]
MSYVLFQFDPVEKFVSTVGRRAAIHILPIFDWTKFYESNCLVSNPLHESQSELKLEDCNICESVNKIERIKDITEAKLVNKYLKQDRPVIVQDGLKQNDISKFTVDFLTKIFEDSMFEGCEFTSNVKVGGHRSFLKQVNAGEHEHYFAYWRNCFEEPAKEFRFYFKKPYFFSSVVELIDTNWVYIAKNYTAKSSKPILIEGPVIMLMQMKGSVDIVLIPDKLCSDICSEVTQTLHEGEILLLTDFLWLIDYYPRGTGESIGIGVTASFD